MEVSINWLAIVVAALVPMILGFIWYHPKVFGNAWMKSLNFTEDDLKGGNMPLIFGLSFVLSFILALFTFFIIDFMHCHESFQTFKHGMLHGAILAVTIAMPVFVTNGLFERKSASNLLINAGYWLVCLSLIGGIVDAWRV